MWVEQSEVVDDDRHGQVERQYSEQGAHWPHQHPEVGAWCQVTIADRRHGNDRPPKSEWNGRKSGVVRWTAGELVQSFGVVDEWREDDESNEEKEDEQA